MRKFLSVILLLTVSGCTVGPDYMRPPISTSAAWTVSYDAAAGVTDIAWWQQFDDPVIDDLISPALSNNLNLKAAMARVRRASEAAQTELLASEAGRRTILLTLVSNVAGNYLILRGLGRQLEIARETIIGAFRDAEDALMATTEGRERQAAQGRRTSALTTYSRLAKSQYEAGTAGYLQVLDANRGLFPSQLDYVQTQTTVLTSLISVYTAMGSGWGDEADRLSQPKAPETEPAGQYSLPKG